MPRARKRPAGPSGSPSVGEAELRAKDAALPRGDEGEDSPPPPATARIRTPLKRCRLCRQEIPRDREHFWYDRSRWDGFCTLCIACHKKDRYPWYRSTYYPAHRDRIVGRVMNRKAQIKSLREENQKLLAELETLRSQLSAAG